MSAVTEAIAGSRWTTDDVLEVRRSASYRETERLVASSTSAGLARLLDQVFMDSPEAAYALLLARGESIAERLEWWQDLEDAVGAALILDASRGAGVFEEWERLYRARWEL